MDGEKKIMFHIDGFLVYIFSTETSKPETKETGTTAGIGRISLVLQ